MSICSKYTEEFTAEYARDHAKKVSRVFFVKILILSYLGSQSKRIKWHQSRAKSPKTRRFNAIKTI